MVLRDASASKNIGFWELYAVTAGWDGTEVLTNNNNALWVFTIGSKHFACAIFA